VEVRRSRLVRDVVHSSSYWSRLNAWSVNWRSRLSHSLMVWVTRVSKWKNGKPRDSVIADLEAFAWGEPGGCRFAPTSSVRLSVGKQVSWGHYIDKERPQIAARNSRTSYASFGSKGPAVPIAESGQLETPSQLTNAADQDG